MKTWSSFLSLIPILAGMVLSTGCDSDSKPKKKSSDLEESGQDVPTDNFAYEETAEFALDADAFLNINTKEEFHVGSLYFEGGSGKNCAKWEITITGEEVRLARGDQLKADAQTRLTETPEGTLTGTFETRGTIPGVRFTVKKDSVITFSGVQSYCKTDDRADFKVQENVEKSKLHEIFRGVEVKGIAFMTLKFSDEKSAASVEKIKEQLAAATTPDPATTAPAAEPGAETGEETEADPVAPTPAP
jgi:hypothetical protein